MLTEQTTPETWQDYGENKLDIIYILWWREVRKYSRSRPQVIASLGQPLLYLFVLGYGLDPVFERAGSGSYLQFIAPGIIGMVILYSATFSGTALLWDRQFGFLKETLVAPIHWLQIMVGRTLGGSTVAMCQGTITFLICLAAGFRPIRWGVVPLAMLLMLSMSLVFTAFGICIGSSLKDMQGFQLVMNFVVMPIFFLSGALFPLSHVPTMLAWGTHIDPLSYGVDGLRDLFIGQTHFGLAIDIAFLLTAIVVLFAVGAWRFSKIEI
jgi:ABC-2 type transport system permease protein